MAFGKLFGRKPSPAPTDDPEAMDTEAEDAPDDAPEYVGELEAADLAWRERASGVIPGGTSTGSKRAAALFGEGNTHGPTHYVSASGCHLVTVGDESLIDCTMALGSVALGYADEGVTRAVMQAAAHGNVAGLAHYGEVELAERLCGVIPCAERVRFLKSGAEGVSAAVRIARAASGRTHVIASGYFGWHDWASDAAGVPAAVRRDVTRVPFDDTAALVSACAVVGGNLAAIVLEPVVERLPAEEWIATARRLATELGAVLVFDEMKTGFRLRPGGYQELSGVTPDLAVFGKALANGYPLAAVVGSAGIMAAAERTWISSTLAGEGVALAAAGAVLDAFDAQDVCATLSELGGAMRRAVDAAIQASGISGVRTDGLDAMWLLRFDSETVERRFLEAAVGRGVLFKRGAYNYPAVAHGEDDVLVDIERAASSAFVDVQEDVAS